MCDRIFWEFYSSPYRWLSFSCLTDLQRFLEIEGVLCSDEIDKIIRWCDTACPGDVYDRCFEVFDMLIVCRVRSVFDVDDRLDHYPVSFKGLDFFVTKEFMSDFMEGADLEGEV